MPNAPGKSYREGISLIEVFGMFPDDLIAEQWFERRRWGESGRPGHCPICGSVEKIRAVVSRDPLPWRCEACRRNFSVRTGTVMHRSRIGLQKWAVATYLWAMSLKGVSSMRLHRDLSITQKSAWFMAQRLRAAWSSVAPVRMEGPVEANETYVGGKEADRHARKKLKTGRGAVGKTFVAGVLDRETNTVQAGVFAKTDAETLQGFVKQCTVDEAKVYTDEALAYRGIEREHETVNHDVRKYVRGEAHTNGTESFWVPLDRAHKGVFRKFSPKHLHRCVDEFATRHNLRPEDTEVIMAKTVARMIGMRLMYRDLIADNGLPSGARS